MTPADVYFYHQCQQTDYASRISPFVWQQSPKCQLFGQIITSKITLIYRQFLIQIICSKMKSLYLQQTSRSDLGIWLEVFLSTLSEGYTSAILSDPVLRISRCLVYARKEFWVIAHFTVVCLVTWPWSGSEAGGDRVLIQASLLFICRSCCSYAN